MEIYLSEIIPALNGLGHEVAFLSEVDEPVTAERVTSEQTVACWSVSTLGRTESLATLANWKPDVIFAHGLQDPAFEAKAAKIAPTVFFIHNYHGTCVSGTKTFSRPVVTPCSRRFGLGCLLCYYPRRCGGLNPVTMIRLYHRQAVRLKTVRSCDAVVTHSHHMYCEFAKHGVALDRLHRFPYYAAGTLQQSLEKRKSIACGLPVLEPAESSCPPRDQAASGWRLVFVGRMDRLKGGIVLLEALPQVARRLGLPLQVTFAGDGPERRMWEGQAARLQTELPRLQIRFTGWLSQAQLEPVFANSDLVVVPSVWPEPFGLVGPEAGWRGIPVAAFAVGGIRDWLIDGVNGRLAPGDPPTAVGLAEAITGCLRDPAAHALLRRGAIEMAQRFNRRDHLRSLMEVFESVRRRR